MLGIRTMWRALIRYEDLVYQSAGALGSTAVMPFRRQCSDAESASGSTDSLQQFCLAITALITMITKMYSILNILSISAGFSAL